MANVLNRTTKVYLESVNTPEYDPAEWIINPDITPVLGVPYYFWYINEDDTVRPMTAMEQDTSWLIEAKDLQRSKINAIRDEKISNGFWFQGYLYDTDAIARTNASSTVAAVTAGMTIPAGFTWRDAENNNVPMNAAKVVQFGVSMLAYVSGLYKYSWTLKAAYEAMTTLEELRDQDIINGWPPRNFDGSAPPGRD